MKEFMFENITFIINEESCNNQIQKAKDRTKKYQQNIDKWKKASDVARFSFLLSLPVSVIILLVMIFCFDAPIAIGWFVFGLMAWHLVIGGLGCWTADRLEVAETGDYTRLLDEVCLFYVRHSQDAITSIQLLEDVMYRRDATLRYSCNLLYTMKDIKYFKIIREENEHPRVDLNKRILYVSNPYFASITVKRGESCQ